MKTTIFKNKGDFAIECISVFGASAKGSQNSIGKFGTGLKYAIAILLREGIEISLWIKGSEYKFGTADLNMRGNDFAQVTMNENALPFTTNLGAHWEVWQAFRELESNCRDEKGITEVYEENEAYSTSGDIVFVVHSDEFAEFVDNKSVFLDAQPDLQKNNISVTFEPSNIIYNNGIKVYKNEVVYANTYNLTGPYIELTEDRTLKDVSIISANIITLLRLNTDYNLFKTIAIKTNTAKAEDGISYCYSCPTSGFLDNIERALKEGLTLNPSLMTEYERVKQEWAVDGSLELVIRVFHKDECGVDNEYIKEMIQDNLGDLSIITIEVEK